MTDEFDRVALGSRVTVGREHSVRRIRDIPEPAAVELEAKFRRVREMAEPDADARVNASGSEPIDYWATITDTIEQLSDSRERSTWRSPGSRPGGATVPHCCPTGSRRALTVRLGA